MQTREKNQTQIQRTDPSFQLQREELSSNRKYVFLLSIGEWWSIFAIPRRYQKKRKKIEREREKKERIFLVIIIPYDKTSADITLSGRNVLANVRISSEKERYEDMSFAPRCHSRNTDYSITRYVNREEEEKKRVE